MMGRLMLAAVVVTALVGVDDSWGWGDQQPAGLDSTDHDEFFDALVPGYRAEGVIGSELLFRDVNGDGFDDLIMGAPEASVRGHDRAGAVTVIPGGPTGLVPSERQRWTRARRGVDGAARPGQAFGEAVATGDFDGDGFEDLAVGAPGASTARSASTGVVHVLYGTPDGLTARGDQRWHEGVDGVPGRRGSGDRLGSELAAGDFDGDGFDDLVIETRDGADSVPALLVLRGGPAGLDARGSRLLTEVPAGMPAHTLDLATALAVDLDEDGFDELVLGSPGEDGMVGVVTVWAGSAAGLDVRSVTRLDGGWSTPNLGLTLDVADIDGDGWLDLIASAPHKLRVARGSAEGLGPALWDHWPYHLGTCCWGSKGHFVPVWTPGEVVVGDFDGDRRPDVVVGRRWAGLFMRGQDVIPAWGVSLPHWGEGVRAVGDPNGDGVDDVASYRVNDGRANPQTGEMLPFVSVRYGTRTPTCGGRPVTVFLARGDRPTDGDDVILGTPRADRIAGGAGDDAICGGGGDDRINGGDGDDVIYGEGGADRLNGGMGSDRLYGGSGTDRLAGGEGDDMLHGGDEPDRLTGGAGHDALFGERGSDTLLGGPGDDVLSGDRFEDMLRFGLGVEDACDGGTGEDRISNCGAVFEFRPASAREVVDFGVGDAVGVNTQRVDESLGVVGDEPLPGGREQGPAVVGELDDQEA